MEDEVVVDPRRDAARHVLKRKAAWFDSMQTKRSTWARLDKRYFNFREDLAATDGGAQNAPRANIGVPLAAETVDTAVARAFDAEFRQRPYGTVLGREESDQMKSEVVQAVMDYQMDQVDFANVGQEIFRDAYKYGVGFGKFHFKRETRMVPETMKFMGIPLPGVTEMVEKVVFQSPVLERVNPHDMFLPLDAPSVSKAEGLIHRTWMTGDQIRAAVDGLGVPLYDVAVLADVKTSGSGKDSDASLATQYATRKIADDGLDKDDRYPVLEYTGRLPGNLARSLGGSSTADFIITVIDGHDVPLRVEPSPYLFDQRPYVVANVVRDPGYICGISIIEFVEKLGLTIDELYNVMMDNLNLIINKVVYINTLAGIDEADIVMTPGKIIRGRRPPSEAIQPLEFPDLSQSAFLLINMLLSHYKEYTGIQNQVLGGGSGGRQTAYETASIDAHSATRLGGFEQTLEMTFMRPCFELWTLFNQQFIDEEFVIRIFKDSQYMYPKVAPEDMQGMFDFIFEGAARAQAQALEIGQYMQLLQIDLAQPIPLLNRPKIMERILVAMRMKNIVSLLNPEYGQQLMIMQQMQMMKDAGETAKALTPDQQKQQSKPGGKGGSSKTAAANTPQSDDFRSALTAVKESALPPMPTEG